MNVITENHKRKANPVSEETRKASALCCKVRNAKKALTIADESEINRNERKHIQRLKHGAKRAPGLQ